MDGARDTQRNAPAPQTPEGLSDSGRIVLFVVLWGVLLFLCLTYWQGHGATPGAADAAAPGGLHLLETLACHFFAALFGVGIGYAVRQKRAKEELARVRADAAPRPAPEALSTAKMATPAVSVAPVGEAERGLRARIAELEAGEAAWKARFEAGEAAWKARFEAGEAAWKTKVAELEAALAAKEGAAAAAAATTTPADPRLAQLQAELAALGARHSSLESERTRLSLELGAAKKHWAEADASAQRLAEEREVLKSQFESVARESADARDELNRAAEGQAQLEARLRELEGKLAAGEPAPDKTAEVAPMKPAEAKKARLAEYLADVCRYSPNASDKAVAAIVKYCGIALGSPGSAQVTADDAGEKASIVKGFAAKKLGLAAEEASRGFDVVVERMKASDPKPRVTFYYLLAEATDTLDKLR